MACLVQQNEVVGKCSRREQCFYPWQFWACFQAGYSSVVFATRMSEVRTLKGGLGRFPRLQITCQGPHEVHSYIFGVAVEALFQTAILVGAKYSGGRQVQAVKVRNGPVGLLIPRLCYTILDSRRLRNACTVLTPCCCWMACLATTRS